MKIQGNCYPVLLNSEIEEAKQRYLPKPALHLMDTEVFTRFDPPWKVRSSIKHWLQLNLSPVYIPHLRSLVPSKPFQIPKSRVFLQACKEGDTKQVRALLRENRWLALSFDAIKQTGLHWVVKRRHVELIPILVEYGNFIDAKDCAGRTALFIAARKGHVEEVRELLALKANATLRSNTGKTPRTVCKSQIALKLLEKSVLLTILMKFVPKEKREKVWEKEGVSFFRAEDSET